RTRHERNGVGRAMETVADNRILAAVLRQMWPHRPAPAVSAVVGCIERCTEDAVGIPVSGGHRNELRRIARMRGHPGLDVRHGRLSAHEDVRADENPWRS